MHGSLSTGSTRGREARRAAAEVLGAWLIVCAVGAAAGLVSAHVRLHLGLPGHKALVLMTPVVAAAMVLRLPGAAAGGMTAAALVSLAAGGNAIAAAAHLPLAAMAGGIVDAAVALASRRRAGTAATFALAGLAGLAANMVLLAERLLAPLYQSHVLLGMPGLGGRAFSYAAFGLASGLAGAVLAAALRWRLSRGERKFT